MVLNEGHCPSNSPEYLSKSKVWTVAVAVAPGRHLCGAVRRCAALTLALALAFAVALARPGNRWPGPGPQGKAGVSGATLADRLATPLGASARLGLCGLLHRALCLRSGIPAKAAVLRPRPHRGVIPFGPGPLSGSARRRPERRKSRSVCQSARPFTPRSDDGDENRWQGTAGRGPDSRDPGQAVGCLETGRKGPTQVSDRRRTLGAWKRSRWPVLASGWSGRGDVDRVLRLRPSGSAVDADAGKAPGRGCLRVGDVTVTDPDGAALDGLAPGLVPFDIWTPRDAVALHAPMQHRPDPGRDRRWLGRTGDHSLKRRNATPSFPAKPVDGGVFGPVFMSSTVAGLRQCPTFWDDPRPLVRRRGRCLQSAGQALRCAARTAWPCQRALLNRGRRAGEIVAQPWCARPMVTASIPAEGSHRQTMGSNTRSVGGLGA
jgi:hypothetical protein